MEINYKKNKWLKKKYKIIFMKDQVKNPKISKGLRYLFRNNEFDFLI